MANPSPGEKFALTTSRGFVSLLDRLGGAIALTTYQAGKLFLLGRGVDGRLSVHERTFARCMGLAVSADAQDLLLATHYQIYRFRNVLPKGERQGAADAVYVPRQSWITGDLDIHDIAFDREGKPVFVNTAFNCLATTGDGCSFRPMWMPPFIDRLVAEDRCHLNGVAVEDGAPRYVTAVSRSNVVDGWRDRRRDGGIVMDVSSREIVCGGPSMPHSPRLHGGRLWLLNAGTGEFGHVDRKAGRFEPVAFCPGYARGLAFAGNHAIIGLSMARENRTFQGLPLDDALKQADTEARCGFMVIDLATGTTAGWARIEGVVRELYDVAFLPGVRTPVAIGLVSDEITRVINIDLAEGRCFP